MLAMIGDFKFDINDTNFEELDKSLSIRFSSNQRFGNFDTYQKSGKYEESITITGTLIVKSQNQLTEFKKLAKAGKPLTFVTNNIIKTILIFSLGTKQNSFLKDGMFLKQTYTIVLQVLGK